MLLLMVLALGILSIVGAILYRQSYWIPNKLFSILLLISLPTGIPIFASFGKGSVPDITGLLLLSIVFYSIELTGAGLYYHSSRTILLASGFTLIIAFLGWWSVGYYIFLLGLLELIVAIILIIVELLTKKLKKNNEC
ncbi:MAG: hypothetical protein ACYC2T_12715 [Bacillota bacterium]